MNGVTLLAALLIATPLVQWSYLSVLAHFTILEPPFTGSRGLPLAMQVFFSPGNVIPIVLGIGLLLRSERTRRVSRVVFAIGLLVATWVAVVQLAARQPDSNLLLAGLSAAICGLCVSYFGRPHVRAQFAAQEAPKKGATLMPVAAATPAPRSLVFAAWVECALGVAAAWLLWHLYTVLGTRPLIDMGPGIGVMEADDLLRQLMLAAFVLFLSPHVLTTAASIGLLLGRQTTRVARRYALIACWTVIGAALVTAWLATREGFAFDPGAVRWIAAFCVVSLVWHACFLYLLARDGPR